jgi:ABC-type multidrug transport system permease subunit
MKIIDIAFKDMLRFFRSAMGVVFMFAMPIGVTGLFYVMFGNIANSNGIELAATKLVVVNLDRSAPRLQAGSGKAPGGFNARTLSELVVEVLRSEDLANLLQVSLMDNAAQAKAAVDSQEAQVAIIIPQGFSSQFADLNGTSQVEFYQDPTLTIGPGIVKSILSQFMDSLSAVKITVDLALDAAENQNPALVGEVVQEYLDTSNTQTDDLSKALLEVRPPQQKPATAADKNPILNIIGPIMGGMMIFYAFYTGTATAESILREEEERTLPRLFTTPTSQATILGGKFLAVFITVAVQMAVLIVAGRLIFGIRWGVLTAVVLMVLGVVLAASGFGVFINSFLKDTKQGGVVFGGVLTVTGMLGMIRIFGMSSMTSRLGDTVGLLVPQGWAVRGLVMAMNGEPLNSVLVNSLALLVWSAVFFVIGVWRFKHRYA